MGYLPAILSTPLLLISTANPKNLIAPRNYVYFSDLSSVSPTNIATPQYFGRKDGHFNMRMPQGAVFKFTSKMNRH